MQSRATLVILFLIAFLLYLGVSVLFLLTSSIKDLSIPANVRLVKITTVYAYLINLYAGSLFDTTGLDAWPVDIRNRDIFTSSDFLESVLMDRCWYIYERSNL